jgi:ATP-dependent RNA helicase DeaD
VLAAPAGDLWYSAQTGSGKTVAYGLAFATNLLGDAETLGQATQPAALVVGADARAGAAGGARTRLALCAAGARIVSCVGGMDPAESGARLAEGATSSPARRGGCATISSAAGLDVSALKPWCSTRPTRCSTSAFARTWSSFSTRRRASGARSSSPPRCRKRSSSPRQALPARRAAHRGVGGRARHADIEYRAVRVAPERV